MRLPSLIIVAMLLMCPSWARAGDEAACRYAVAGAAQRLAIPHIVLNTIALVESGRPIGNRLVPWPWSINVGGIGRVFASKEEAVAAVRELNAAGIWSIDVGCMQINLAAHPQAFDSLETAFDPVSNANYAAHFLQTLSQQTGQLGKAITAYHSQTREYAAEYAGRIIALWPGAATLGLTAIPSLPIPPTADTPLSRRLSEDRAGPQRFRPRPSSQIEAVSSHGAAWPAASH